LFGHLERSFGGACGGRADQARAAADQQPDHGAAEPVAPVGPDLGVQVSWPGKPLLRLDEDKPNDRLYYHVVAIPADEKYVFAISRYIPPPGDSKPERAVLRVWSITGTTRVGAVPSPNASILPPVEALMFLPDQQRFLLATWHTVEVWSLK
jgi:hypothetical protein